MILKSSTVLTTFLVGFQTPLMVGAIMGGPRVGRFVDGKVVKIEGHNKTLVLLGGLILWFGWVSVDFTPFWLTIFFTVRIQQWIDYCSQ